MKRFLPVLALLALPAAAEAAVVDLTLSASWTAADYDVISTGPAGSTAVEADDDKVFGIAPSDGSLSLTLQVDTASEMFYDATTFSLAHDFYGYSAVSILGGSFSYGSATWTTADILTDLVGPAGDTKALWTDVSLTAGDPVRVSFRMLASWFDASADVFFGSRVLGGSGLEITDSFLLWEYFGGEEVRTTGYEASVAPVPVPAGGLLLLSGLSLLALRRRRRG